MPGIKITNTAGIAAAGESVILHAAAVHAVHALMQPAASRERCQAPEISHLPAAGMDPHRTGGQRHTPPFNCPPGYLPARPPRPGRTGGGTPSHRVVSNPDPAPRLLPCRPAPRQHCSRWARAEGITWELGAGGAALTCPALPRAHLWHALAAAARAPGCTAGCTPAPHRAPEHPALAPAPIQKRPLRGELS